MQAVVVVVDTTDKSTGGLSGAVCVGGWSYSVHMHGENTSLSYIHAH